jgi:hypothetical protein
MTRNALYLLLLAGACRQEKAPPAESGSAVQSSTTPTIEILSPRAGDRWAEGTRQVIRWRTSGIVTLDLSAAVGGKDKGHILIGAPAEPDSVVWEIPVGFVTGFGPDSATNVRIRLEDFADATRFADSDSFTIVGSVRP